MPAPHRIDVHHHILPDFYVEALARVGVTDAGGVALPKWSAEAELSLMDRCGIATAVTSVAAPGVHFGNDAAARSLARRCNELSARLVTDHPARFGAFAQLPMPDVDGALEEIAYAFDVLNADGVVMLTNIAGRYLGDPAFDAVFAELNRRKAVVFIHPTVPPGHQALKLAMPAALIEFVFDTTRTVTSLIYSGTLERYPDVSFILSHAGGTIPYVASRIAVFAMEMGLQAKTPKGVISYLKRLYYDTAISATPYALSSLSELVAPSQILFGSDYPFLPETFIDASIQGLADYKGFDAATRESIERDNALALFPRLRALDRPSAGAKAVRSTAE